MKQIKILLAGLFLWVSGITFFPPSDSFAESAAPTTEIYAQPSSDQIEVINGRLFLITYDDDGRMVSIIPID